MELNRAPHRLSGTGAEAGFSMIEALIASAVLLILAIGMIPLFTRAMVNNALGNDYTQATAHGLTGLEKSAKIPLQSTDLSGAHVQYVAKSLQTGSPVSDLDWKYTQPSVTVWTRTTQQRYYSVTALDDGQLTTDELVTAGSSIATWNLMEVTTLLDSGKLNSGGSGHNATGLAAIRQTNFQYLKAF